MVFVLLLKDDFFLDVAEFIKRLKESISISNVFKHAKQMTETFSWGRVGKSVDD